VNVKPDDIARIVNSPPNNGRIVKVLRLDLTEPGHWWCEPLQTLDGFRVTGPFGFLVQEVKLVPGMEVCIADVDLRPLYDGDAEDEVLRLTGKPNETPSEIIEAITA
jgi:hypothetical protein